MNLRWILVAGVAAGATLATGLVAGAPRLLCGVVVVVAAVCAVACLAWPLLQRVAPPLPAGVTAPAIVVVTVAYLLMAPVALHLIGVRLTDGSAAMAATALPFAALFLPHPPRIEARVLAWSASLIALLAVAVAFAPLAERHIDVTTPATEFSSLSFASPMSGGVNRVTGPALVDVVYDGPAVSSDDLMATFSGAPVAPQTVTSAGGAHRLRYRFVLPADGCERTFSVRARPVDPGRRPSLRGDEAALDDASRSTLQLTTRFINGVSTLDCDGPADLQSASGGDEA